MHISQTMAECDCQHDACAARKYCMAAEIERLRAALTEAKNCLDGEPDYHSCGMGCGLEDRGITDRYAAMEHGWCSAIERMQEQHVSGALEIISAALEVNP